MMKPNGHLRLALYHGLPAGGARRTAHEHARRLSHKHEVALFTLGASDEGTLDIRPFVKVESNIPFVPTRLFKSPLGRFNQAIRISDALRLRALAMSLASSVDAGGYDAVLVHPCQYTNAPWLLQFLNTPSVYYCHEHNRLLYEQIPARPYAQRPLWRQALDRIDPIRQSYFRLFTSVEKMGLRAANRVLVNSLHTLGEVNRIHGIQASVNYHGVDPDDFRDLGLPSGDFVLSVGNLSPWKSFDLIVKALGRISASKRPRLVIVSFHQAPAERKYLEHLAIQEDVNLRIEVMVGEKRLVELYNKALITIYVPVREPFGMVPLESMSCGTPVIGVSEGGVKETVKDGITGRLVPRNTEALADAISQLIGNRQMRSEMGSAGRRYVKQNWTWDRSIAGLERHLFEVAGHRHGSIVQAEA